MPTCCVPGCKSGYPREKDKELHKEISFHKFPSDSTMRVKWIRAIRRENYEPSSSSSVCSLHFYPSDYLNLSVDRNQYRKRDSDLLTRRRLKKEALPRIITNAPAYLTSPPPLVRSGNATSSNRLQYENQIIADQINRMNKEDTVQSLDDIYNWFQIQDSIPGDFELSSSPEILHFIQYDLSSIPPSITASISVEKTLDFSVYHRGIHLDNSSLKMMQFCSQINRFSDLLNLMAFLNSCESESSSKLNYIIELLEEYIENDDINSLTKSKCTFILEQLSLMNKSPNSRRFSNGLLINSILWHSHSSACYNSILNSGLMTLPSLSTIKRLNSFLQLDDSNIKSYLKARRTKLNDHEACVTLIFDEVYIFQHAYYQNGRYFGLTADGNTPASTILVYMIKSLSSKYCDVVCMVPISKISVEVIRNTFETAFKTCLECGFNIVCTIADNHPVNRSFFKSVLCGGELCSRVEYPPGSNRKLHILIDPVHTIKNIFNNFQKSEKFVFPGEDGEWLEARFSVLRKIYDMECSLPLRMAYKINPNVLSPTNVQRSSFKLAASVFDESTCHALEFYKKSHKSWVGTATFIRKINSLLRIIHVRTSTVGIHKRDVLRQPVIDVDDEKLNILLEFKDFFSTWKNSKNPGLTKETFLAVNLVCDSLVSISKYLLLECGFGFVLLGHLQSDPLERRFGRYRQMSGSNYYISLKNVCESERKIKIYSFLKHSGMTVQDLKALSDNNAIETGSDFIDDTLVEEMRLEANEMEIEENEVNVLCLRIYCPLPVKKSSVPSVYCTLLR